MIKYFNENLEPITETDIDLSKGYLTPTMVIKEDAVPIDNVTKFAWESDDYEEAQMYVLNRESDGAPSDSQRITDLEEALELLLSGVTE